MANYFCWLVEMKMPSGSAWWASEYKGSFALVKDAVAATQFQTKESAEQYLEKLKHGDSTGGPLGKITDNMYVCEHGFMDG